MALDNLLTRLIAQIAKNEAQKDIVSQYGPSSRDDILHDGLVGVGKTWGGILGTAAGIMGGEAIGGPRGAAVGGVALGPAGALGGAWVAHGAYRESQLIGNILSHPDNWTVDAAGAIVPVTSAPNVSLDTDASNDADSRYSRRMPNTADSGSPPLPSSGAGERPAAVLSTPGSLQSDVGRVGKNSAPPIRFLGSRIPLGDDWLAILGG
jgi:hypothetical protein